MSRPYGRCRTVLTAYHPSYSFASSQHTAQSRATRETARRFAERFWAPFAQGTNGADVGAYRLRENLESICMPPGVFTAQVNGAVGGARIVEDYFSVLLAGFDIAQCQLGASEGSLRSPLDPCHYKGSLTLVHARRFLGWAPQVTPAGGAPTVQLPFSMHVEAGVAQAQPLISHLVLRVPVADYLAALNCPPSVRRALADPKTVQAIAALRRAGADTGVITADSLCKPRRERVCVAACASATASASAI